MDEDVIEERIVFQDINTGRLGEVVNMCIGKCQAKVLRDDRRQQDISHRAELDDKDPVHP